ncbi:hypothetical protein ACM76R_30215 [Pseudomonas aeruginosa]|uniref:hypothetical protein n=1 Tax=Pseudomonas aeruginosa TaxID=287 RepID=UPI000FC41D03|nr:hypothetical protein [Pseudomonas aeruginosa]HDK9341717.1 hypothetical protein [Staphylococcus aureus]EIU3807044.1 hypothetical protein [Pseudomonas aeruginosa]EIU3912818.1 hypothetical protein [Pseudomonas aeruginosa]EIU3970596.1 hypothetical protein [Pseudomonas aeruginosa]MBX5969167.1 hypothetical protein [Pseudomonas aeruginosa]
MQSYPQRVRDNILPLSVGSTLPEAFEEWSFTERTVDHEQPTETCRLCDQEQLRYHFEIRNALTQKTLWVGSQCILKFNLSVFENGRRLSSADTKKKLDRLMQQMRLNSCIKALEELAKKEENKILRSALDYYRKNKYLTPKFAFVVLWRLQANQVDHSPTFFKINLKKTKYQQDLAKMSLSQVHVIWPALSSAQRIKALQLGHTPPSKP